jgi:hypothetical protein
MTTITAKSSHPPVRLWKAEENIFVDEARHQLSAFVFHFSGGREIYHYEPLFVPMELTSTRKKWLQSTVEKSLTLPFHKDNWSNGAKRTERGAVQQLFNVLLSVLPDDAPTPDIVPTWLGGVQAEWHRNGVDLEVSVNPGEAVEYYFSSGDDEVGGKARDHWETLKEYSRSIV